MTALTVDRAVVEQTIADRLTSRTLTTPEQAESVAVEVMDALAAAGLVLLDPVTDGSARDALWIYARSCHGTKPDLSREIRSQLLAIASAADPINAYCRANTEPREPIRHE